VVFLRNLPDVRPEGREVQAALRCHLEAGDADGLPAVITPSASLDEDIGHLVDRFQDVSSNFSVPAEVHEVPATPALPTPEPVRRLWARP
jgi:hypothetical protein